MHDDVAAPHALPHSQSRLTFMLNALGSNTLVLPLLALAALTLVVLLLVKGKGPAMVGGILLVTPLPICWGVLSVVSSLASVYGILGLADIEPKPSELYVGYAQILITAQIAIMLNTPAFVAA